MNILISGYFDRNFGDDIMIRIVCHQLSDHQFFAEESRKELLLPFADIPNFHDLDMAGDVVIDKSLRVIGSGFMINDKAGIYYAIGRIYGDKSRLSKNVIGCNIDVNKNAFARWLSKQEIKKYDLVTVRDTFSLAFLKQKIKKRKASCFPDIVFGLPDEWIPKVENEGCLGITAYRRYHANNLDFYKKMAAVIDEFITKHNKKVLLFAFDMDVENDLSAAVTIQSLCREKDMVEIILHNDNGDHVIRNFLRCGKVIAVRFHGCVLAMRLGIPFLPIYYSSKTLHMLDDLDYHGERFFIENFTAEEVSKALEQLTLFQVDPSVFERARLHTKTFSGELI